MVTSWWWTTITRYEIWSWVPHRNRQTISWWFGMGTRRYSHKTFEGLHTFLWLKDIIRNFWDILRAHSRQDCQKLSIEARKVSTDCLSWLHFIQWFQTKRKNCHRGQSTYRKFNKDGSVKKFRFTLGSYRSFLRDPEGKKGILYPYSDYKEHWVIGFLYTRNPECKITEIRQEIEASQLQSPFTDIEFFVQEKYRIAGKTPGSGNTTNIGSISCNNIKDFQEGKLGFPTKSEFDEYWRNYKKSDEWKFLTQIYLQGSYSSIEVSGNKDQTCKFHCNNREVAWKRYVDWTIPRFGCRSIQY